MWMHLAFGDWVVSMHLIVNIQGNNSQSLVPKPSAPVSSENLIEMYILSSHHRLPISNLCFNKPMALMPTKVYEPLLWHCYSKCGPWVSRHTWTLISNVGPEDAGVRTYIITWCLGDPDAHEKRRATDLRFTAGTSPVGEYPRFRGILEVVKVELNGYFTDFIFLLVPSEI